MILRKHSKCLTPKMMGNDAKRSDYIYSGFCHFSVICADELMRVMVSLGNPRTEEEIKVKYLSY